MENSIVAKIAGKRDCLITASIGGYSFTGVKTGEKTFVGVRTNSLPRWIAETIKGESQELTSDLLSYTPLNKKELAEFDCLMKVLEEAEKAKEEYALLHAFKELLEIR